MKDLTKLYCYDQEPDNVESESDGEPHIDIKDNTVAMKSDSEVTTQKIKKRKLPILYSSDDSEEEESNIEEENRKKTIFVDSGSDVIPSNEPK